MPNSKIRITNLLNKKSLVLEVNKNSNFKKEIKNLNPTVIQVNKKFRVKVATINDINEFDIFFNKIVNTKFDNYNIIVE